MGMQELPCASGGYLAIPVKWTKTVRRKADLMSRGATPQIWSELWIEAAERTVGRRARPNFESSGVVVV